MTVRIAALSRVTATTDKFDLDTENFPRYNIKMNQETFEQNTERLKVLNHFVRSFVPAIGDSVRSGNQVISGEIPGNLEQAKNRALISALNQIDRICNQDLLSEGESFDESDDDESDDARGDDDRAD